MQQLTPQQARGARADDRDLRARCSVIRSPAAGMAAFLDQHFALDTHHRHAVLVEAAELDHNDCIVGGH